MKTFIIDHNIQIRQHDYAFSFENIKRIHFSKLNIRSNIINI